MNINSTGRGGISADDPNAIQKLEAKLKALEEYQETMKTVNAYYRKHKTLDNCPHLPPEGIAKLKADMAASWHLGDKPYPSWALSNNNAEIHRIKTRIGTLTRQRETEYVGWDFDGGVVEVNREDNRLQIFFDRKPEEDIRSILKSNGFHWSPRAGAWQRQLGDSAIWAADRIACIRPICGKKPSELQSQAG